MLCYVIYKLKVSTRPGLRTQSNYVSSFLSLSLIGFLEPDRYSQRPLVHKVIIIMTLFQEASTKLTNACTGIHINWQYKLVSTRLLLYRRTATCLKCIGIVSRLVKIIDYITVSDGLGFIQRKCWDLKCWAGFWICEMYFDIFLNEVLEYIIGS